MFLIRRKHIHFLDVCSKISQEDPLAFHLHLSITLGRLWCQGTEAHAMETLHPSKSSKPGIGQNFYFACKVSNSACLIAYSTDLGVSSLNISARGESTSEKELVLIFQAESMNARSTFTFCQILQVPLQKLSWSKDRNTYAHADDWFLLMIERKPKEWGKKKKFFVPFLFSALLPSQSPSESLVTQPEPCNSAAALSIRKSMSMHASSQHTTITKNDVARRWDDLTSIGKTVETPNIHGFSQGWSPTCPLSGWNVPRRHWARV